MKTESGFINEELLEKAIDVWGFDAQCEMIIEECLELVLALQKLKRVRGDKKQKFDNVIDEILNNPDFGIELLRSTNCSNNNFSLSYNLSSSSEYLLSSAVQFILGSTNSGDFNVFASSCNAFASSLRLVCSCSIIALSYLAES